MISYRVGVGSVVHNPGRGCRLRIQEIHRIVGEACTLEADFCRQGCGISRGAVDSAVRNGAELHAPFSVENDTVYRVWEAL